ncbi:MAG: radical SAM protein [Planctomycetota bacterium]|jgi:predicted DNA-binding helix-hairpin-helix protein|nr:radical SAM protein [Planctomycetota bacterium]
MDSQKKLELLADAGRYDLACACGTEKGDDRRKRGAENQAWLYPVTLPNGGSGIMLKTLLSSSCAGDCGYCPLRAGSDAVRRCTLGADELARLFLEYNRRRRLLGLFVSSGVIRDPDHTMERLIGVAKVLRRKYAYYGYIHLKVIPGASDAAIEEAISLVNAVSVNIETPNAAHCARLSSRKNWRTDIMRPIETIHRSILSQKSRKRVKQTTQFVVGAADESDREIVGKSFELYNRLEMQRIYFSAYQKGAGDPRIPGEARRGGDLLTREHRLYQSDFLIRRYGFGEKDILFGKDGNLSLANDPKQCWADANPGFFPLHARKAERWQLLRVPGIGPTTVERILKFRRETTLRDITDVGVKGKRANLAAKYLEFS